MDGSRRVKVLLFAAASVIALLSGALAGALTREPPPAEAVVEVDCVGSRCADPVPSPSVAPTFACGDPADAGAVACASPFDEHDDEEDDDGDSSGPGGGGNSGPG